jgi:hypothetical protein
VHEVERDVDQLILLAADEATPAGLHQQGAHVDAVLVRGRFRVPQEAGVDARVAERQGLAVDPHRPVVQRADQVLGRVLEREQVAAVLPALKGGGSDERLKRAVARPGAVARQRRVDAGDALLDRGQRVGHRQREVLVGVDADLGAGIEDVAVGADALAHAAHPQVPAGIGDVDAVRAVGLHQRGLPGQVGGRRQVAHHQETGDVHAQLAGGRDVLGGDVGLGAVGGDPDRADPEGERVLEVGDRADAGQQQRGQPRVGDRTGHGLDPFLAGVAARPVDQARAGQPVAVRDLDRVHAGRVEGGGDPGGLLRRDPVPGGVHAVPQGDILNVKPPAHAVVSHDVVSHDVVSRVRAAIRSPTRRAADVMMSRLPA